MVRMESTNTLTQTLVKPYSDEYLHDAYAYVEKTEYKEHQLKHIEYCKEKNSRCMVLAIDGERTHFEFYNTKAGKKVPLPTLPLRGCGELWYTGWDIPTKWAIDNSGVCWLGGAPVAPEKLIADAEKEKDKNTFRALLGMPTLCECPHCKGKGWVERK